MLSLLLIQRVAWRRWVGGKTLTYALVGLAMLAAFQVRGNGIVLPGVLLLSQLVAHRRALRGGMGRYLKENPEVLLPYLVFGTGAVVVKLLLPGGSSSYLDFFSGLSARMLASHVVSYLVLPARIYTKNLTLISLLLYGLTLPFLLIGLYRNFLRDLPDALYCAFTLPLLIVWPTPVEPRFIFSVFPFYLYFTFLGLIQAEAFLGGEAGGRGFKARVRTLSLGELPGLLRKGLAKPVRARPGWLVRAFGLLVLALFVFRTSADALSNVQGGRKREEGPSTRTSQEMFAYISSNTPAEAEIVFFEPRVLSLFTKRQSVRITELSAIEAGKGDYLVYQKVEKKGYQVSSSALEQLKARHPVRFENEEFLVLQLSSLSAFREQPAKQDLR
ncbi:hypothetical protein BH24BAC1_BH24BAC1_35170 [soil metagenome]